MAAFKSIDLDAMFAGGPAVAVAPAKAVRTQQTQAPAQARGSV
jgi:hypothetical protein